MLEDFNNRASLETIRELTDGHRWEELRHFTHRALKMIDESPHPFPELFLKRVVDSAHQTGISYTESFVAARRLGGTALERHEFIAKNCQGLDEGTYVSLGCECHAWNLLNRWGFRNSIRDLSPLCLGVHRFPQLFDILESEFKNYAQIGNISAKTHRASQLDMVVDKAYGVTWNHHRGSEWTVNEFERFREHVSELIPNFYQSSKRPGAVHIVSRWVSFVPSDVSSLDRLLRIIENAGASCPRLIILDFEENKMTPGLHRIADNVDFISSPYPPGYEWSNPKYRNSPEGLEWEKNLVSHVLDAL
ncbi:hypothetical protein [Mangrovicoccus algicola]|uniref:Uncharacterized protein n=1 Tax=Mangrovicoccus algicola TaxID=2771008 RepID=A0A8J7CGS6_9RHOB|nr:hypothetical protein [Mangrovicoccus algicola]MBE3637440.1 hypothetical protein [Mangrovicoccus algicola]